MAKITGKYEVLYIINPTLGEVGIAALVEKFKAMVEAEGTLTNIDEWGKRRLAYPIEKFTEGYYVIVNFQSEGNFPAELERLFGINDSIIRSIVIRLENAPAVKAEETNDAAETAEAPAEEKAE